jgi:hypothetical protein
MESAVSLSPGENKRFTLKNTPLPTDGFISTFEQGVNSFLAVRAEYCKHLMLCCSGRDPPVITISWSASLFIFA